MLVDKNEILNKLFRCKWDTNWNNIGAYIISLFYKENGFSGLYDFILSEQNNNSHFDKYYSNNLPELLLKAKNELTDSDFKNYILKNADLQFNRHNFLKLEEYGLLYLFEEFRNTMRGNIKSVHKIMNYVIIECTDIQSNSDKYYVKTRCFDTLDEALLHCIFNGKYEDTLSTLLTQKNKLQNDNNN